MINETIIHSLPSVSPSITFQKQIITYILKAYIIYMHTHILYTHICNYQQVFNNLFQEFHVIKIANGPVIPKSIVLNA